MTKTEYERLFRLMQYCPICGTGLRRFGSDSSEFKTCENDHGTMKVTGRHRGQQTGIFLELFEA